MKKEISRRTFCATAAVGAMLGLPALAADKFPVRPVTLLVNFPPGGITDGTFRRLAERFKAMTGQSLIIENKPGRGIASAALAKARPDGYTLGILGRTHMSLYEQLNGKLPYHPVNDFTWIANITSSYFGLYVSAKSPYQSLEDVIAAAKATPGGLRYGTSFGHGGLSHVPMTEFESAAGIEMQHIPFKGDSESIMLLIQGEIDMIVAGGTAIPFVDSGDMRLLAWLSPQRNPRQPDVPTFTDLGYAYQVLAPVGIGGPKGLAPELVGFYEKVFQQLLEDPEILAFLDSNYQRVDFMDGQTFQAWAEKQLPIEKEIVKNFNLANQDK